MIPYQNYEIYASVTLFVIAKIVSEIVQKYRVSMYDKRTHLTSIPEYSEIEDVVKWVPKKKHEVLKAKYKCLKKLFQIYDASVIGLLPESCPVYEDEHRERERRHRRKHSHRTKTDASAGTNETSSGDMSLTEIKMSTATSVDLSLSQYSTDTTDNALKLHKTDKSDKSTQDFGEKTFNSDRENESVQTLESHPIPCLFYIERRKRRRFQNFLYRIFGIKPQRRFNVSPSGREYAASDNNLTNRYEKRRRRGLRLRRRRPKRTYSEFAIGDLKSPTILSYVQSIQKSYLMDTAPRQCPIIGCKLIFYGIINYNDHLNLCHFPDRKFICHYCHEGSLREHDKLVHENEHLGISKMVTKLGFEDSVKIASNTQTEADDSKKVPEDKLKKMVSFFDKISDPRGVFDQMKKRIHSESNIGVQQTSKSGINQVDESKSGSEKPVGSCDNLLKIDRKFASSDNSDMTPGFACGGPVTCRFCGEVFKFRRQLSLHLELEHRVHGKFSKFHSCAGIVNQETTVSEEGRVEVESIGGTSQSTCTELTRNSEDACEPSMNIVFYTSAETIKPSSKGLLQKNCSYKWEPGSKFVSEMSPIV